MFKNLKIRFFFTNEVILSRYTSIDSILLSKHYPLQKRLGNIDRDVFTETKDDLENLSKWLEIKNEVLSGSIWYINEDEFIMLRNIPIRKVTDVDAMEKITGRMLTKSPKAVEGWYGDAPIHDKALLKAYDEGRKNAQKGLSSGEFKNYDLAFETMRVEEVYFYIRGDKEYIETLCKQVKNIGKKSSSGYGRIKNFQIIEVDEDKSFMLDEYTPSKPLPVKGFDVDSKKVAFHRTLPPYSDKKEKEACYMPTSSLFERSDTSRLNKNFKVASLDKFVSNTQYLNSRLNGGKTLAIASSKRYAIIGENDKGQTLFHPVEALDCACCGAEVKKGVVGDLKAIVSTNFNDFPDMSLSKALCADCLWALSSSGEKDIGYSLVNDKTAIYVQGGKMQIFSENKTENSKLQSRFRRDLIENFSMQEVPFSLNFKTTQNTQHVGFKGNVSISNALVSINYGDSGAEFVDVELLNEAIADMIRIMDESKTVNTKGKQNDDGFKKTHLLNLEDYKGNADIKAENNTPERRKVLSDFHKKYDSSIRKVLHKIVF